MGYAPLATDGGEASACSPRWGAGAWRCGAVLGAGLVGGGVAMASLLWSVDAGDFVRLVPQGTLCRVLFATRGGGARVEPLLGPRQSFLVDVSKGECVIWAGPGDGVSTEEEIAAHRDRMHLDAVADGATCSQCDEWEAVEVIVTDETRDAGGRHHRCERCGHEWTVR